MLTKCVELTYEGLELEQFQELAHWIKETVSSLELQQFNLLLDKHFEGDWILYEVFLKQLLINKNITVINLSLSTADTLVGVVNDLCFYKKANKNSRALFLLKQIVKDLTQYRQAGNVFSRIVG